MSRAKQSIGNLSLARVDPARINQINLPGDVLADLQDAFAFYDKENAGYISMTHFRNILHNFGFHRLSKKEIDEELKKHDSDFLKRQAVDFPTVKYACSYRWNRSGKEDEARECFKLFDKRDRNFIVAADLKQVLSNYLEFPVSEKDIEDFITECGGDQNNGNV